MPHRYVLDTLVAPTSNSQAQMFGCDVDGDTNIDNQLGAVLVTLANQGMPTQDAITDAVDRGAAIHLVEVVAASLASGPASVRLFGGTNPDPAACLDAGDVTCRRHFTGTAMFETDGATPEAAAGQIQQGTLRASGGIAVLPLPIFGVDTYTVRAAAVQLVLAPTTIQSPSKLCGTITQGEIETTLYPRIRDAANAAIARDCLQPAQPDCGCADPSEGRTYRGLLDTSPADCTVTLDEVRNNSLITALFAPDVTIGGAPSLSFGFGVTGVGAVFMP